MKTSEFIDYVDKNWFATWELGDSVINIVGIMKVHTNCQLIEFDKKIVTNSKHFRLIEKAIKYAETPLEEREEEKRYNLRLPKPFNSSLGMDYVNFVNGRYMIISKSNIGTTQAEFTQKEIDAMPFDTNFFIKEEVK